MAKRIPLTRGRFALVDDADYEWLSQHKWYAKHHPSGQFYAARARWDGKRHTTFMHREILSAPKGVMVDHINCNGLDNTRANLRLATGNGNYQNKPGWGKSNYKGVCRSVDGKRWIAYCARQHLGTFDTEEEAAHAYDRTAREKFGEFAYLNFQ